MEAVDAAFAACPRERFLPAGARDRAGFDGPIEIGHRQTNSQPRTVRTMLRLLSVEPGQTVLDVGAGSGWTTALLAELTGPTGRVDGVELVPELAAWGQQNLGDEPSDGSGRPHGSSYPWASIRVADPDALGLPAEAPYDRILVSADAPSLPAALTDQLADGGRMVVPVRGTMTLVARRGTELIRSEHGSYRFVPLR